MSLIIIKENQLNSKQPHNIRASRRRQYQGEGKSLIGIDLGEHPLQTTPDLLIQSVYAAYLVEQLLLTHFLQYSLTPLLRLRLGNDRDAGSLLRSSLHLHSIVQNIVVSPQILERLLIPRPDSSLACFQIGASFPLYAHCVGNGSVLVIVLPEVHILKADVLLVASSLHELTFPLLLAPLIAN